MKRIVLERYVSILLMVAVLTVYSQVARNDFLNFDDGQYVTDNNHVQSGLTLRGVIWAFTSLEATNWHPLTWLSHMLDYELFGLNPAGHHLTNLFLHVVNTLLLFLVLRESTGSLWKSAVTAALFGLHPVHVESVAWVSERKDVLSAFFWMLTMLAYIRYSRSPGYCRYLLVLIVFALGLMAKPMLVTLPFVLLLMDFWPLGRTNLSGPKGISDSKGTSDRTIAIVSNLKPLVWEKIPMFLLSAASSVITYIAQTGARSAVPFELLSLRIRTINALVGYMRYLGKMFYPSGLSIFYPHPIDTLNIWHGVVSGFFLFGITVLIIRFCVHSPFLLMGWFWFLGTLVPVIGIVQVGAQAMADRYTYLPSIGVFVMVVWAASGLPVKVPFRKPLLTFAASGVLLCLSIVTWSQLAHWQNSETIFRHAISVTKRNYVAHANLGTFLIEEGRLDEAVMEFKKALEIWPSYPDAHLNFGVALHRQGLLEEAITQYKMALQTEHDNIATAHLNLAVAMIGKGLLSEALSHCSEALLKEPNSGAAHNIIGTVLARLKKMDQAVGHLTRAIDLCQKCPGPYNNLGRILVLQGDFDEAIKYLQKAIDLQPSFAEAYNNMGLALVQKGNLEEAIYYTSSALHFKPDYVRARKNLGNIVRLISKSPKEL